MVHGNSTRMHKEAEKQKLDGEIKQEEEVVVKRVMEKALKEKEDHGAFVIPIHLEAKINLNALVDKDSDINVIPFFIYAKLGRDEVKPMNREITMLNHSKAEPMGPLKDVPSWSNYHYCKVSNSGYAFGQGSPNTCRKRISCYLLEHIEHQR
nr:hypothetical protein [Tanacetum cinerariifolium]